MTAPPLGAVIPGISDRTLVYIAVGAVVFLVFVIGSRVIANVVVGALQRRHMRSDMVVVGSRVVTFGVIGIGVMIAPASSWPPLSPASACRTC
jgi:hypothetical protein